MLILSRKLDESIIIGEKGEIRVKVIGISPQGVRLGFEAPRTVPILREEIKKDLITSNK